jgi:cytochrome c oxidase assembly protein subunit 15
MAMPASDRAQRTARLVARLATAGAALVLVVIVSSAWLRLTQNGLGCSGWPACYGAIAKLDAATQAAPVPAAAYTDEVRATHRVAASAVGVLIGIAAVLWLSGERRRRGVTAGVLAVLALTVFLALLGRYTPGAALPAVTLGNLMGGMALLALLWLLRLQLMAAAPQAVPRALAGAARLALLLVIAQIVLGGLVSAKYAALACPTFPDCNGLWWPPRGSWAAFDPLQALAAAGGDAAQTLHITHRLGAALVACAVASLAVALWLRGGQFRVQGALLAGLLLLQIVLGVALIVAQPLLALAVAHNAVAALLLMVLTGVARRVHTAAPRDRPIAQ